MTCQDCIHFYKQENMNIWTDKPNEMGFCDNTPHGTILVHKNCPVNQWCEDMFKPTHESVGTALDALDSWESISK